MQTRGFQERRNCSNEYLLMQQPRTPRPTNLRVNSCRHFARQTQDFHYDIIPVSPMLEFKHPALSRAPVAQGASSPSPVRTAARNGSPYSRRAVVLFRMRHSIQSVWSYLCSGMMRSRDSVNCYSRLRSCELLKALIEIQRALYLYIEQLQRESAEAGRAHREGISVSSKSD